MNEFRGRGMWPGLDALMRFRLGGGELGVGGSVGTGAPEERLAESRKRGETGEAGSGKKSGFFVGGGGEGCLAVVAFLFLADLRRG